MRGDSDGSCEFASGFVPDADEEKPLWDFVLEIRHRSGL